MKNNKNEVVSDSDFDLFLLVNRRRMEVFKTIEKLQQTKDFDGDMYFSFCGTADHFDHISKKLRNFIKIKS